MKEKFNKFKSNDFVRFTIVLIRTVVYIFVFIIVAMIIIQRVSKNTLSLGGYQLYTIVSESMHPKYRIGDMILTKQTDMNDIKVGEDLVYKGEVGDLAGKTIVHKVVDKRKKNGVPTITTQGLANDLPDPPVYEHQIISKVLYKTVVLSFISKIVNNNYGFYFAILVPLAIIVVMEVADLHDERKEKKLEQEKLKEEKEKTEEKIDQEEKEVKQEVEEKKEEEPKKVEETKEEEIKKEGNEEII